MLVLSTEFCSSVADWTIYKTFMLTPSWRGSQRSVFRSPTRREV